MKRYSLRGAPADVAVAIDRIHVHCDVQAVVEEGDSCEVFVADPLPQLRGVEVEELAIPDQPVTGFENDGPIFVAADLLVRPPWVPRPASFRGLELVVPRAMAFGSGEHGSTQAAMLMLRQFGAAGLGSVLDVGTGSGILALLALELGCDSVIGCDIHEASVRAARELVPSGQFFIGGPEALDRSFDTVVSNMRGAEIREVFPDLIRAWSGTGPLILSGLREHEVDEITGLVGSAPQHGLERGDFHALGWQGTGQVSTA